MKTIISEKQKIIDAAFQCFLENGYANTSIQNIVDKYGKSKGALYYHFKNKEDIIVSMFKNRIHSQLIYLIKIQGNIKDLESLIDKILDLFFDFLENNIEFLKVMIEFWSISQHNKTILEFLEEHRKIFYELLLKYKKNFKSKEFFENWLDFFWVVLAGLRVEKIIKKKHYSKEYQKYIKKILLKSVIL